MFYSPYTNGLVVHVFLCLSSLSVIAFSYCMFCLDPGRRVVLGFNTLQGTSHIKCLFIYEFSLFITQKRIFVYYFIASFIAEKDI